MLVLLGLPLDVGLVDVFVDWMSLTVVAGGVTLAVTHDAVLAARKLERLPAFRHELLVLLATKRQQDYDHAYYLLLNEFDYDATDVHLAFDDLEREELVEVTDRGRMVPSALGRDYLAVHDIHGRVER